jgi:hypothetical protein
VTTTQATIRIRVALALVLTLSVGVLAGCGSNNTTDKSSTTRPVAATTAKTALKTAISTLSTTAPDGKLLVAQTAGPVTTSSTPVWEFLIGSPKTDVIYAVVVQQGKGQFEEYGQANLTAKEWTEVPSIDAWKIDSDVAHEKAVAVYPNGKNGAYVAGFVTFIPKGAENEGTKALTWTFNFDPATKGKAATSTVNVDMGSGQASLAK